MCIGNRPPSRLRMAYRKAPQLDFIRYIIGLALFLGTSLGLAFAAHLVLTVRAKRKASARWDREK